MFAAHTGAIEKAAAARRKDVRTRDFVVVVRIEVGLCANTNASTRKRVNL